MTKIRFVAQQPPRYVLLDSFHEFERAFDELFEDLLITRWRGVGRATQGSRARVFDLEDKYEVHIAELKVDPGQIEVEATDRRLTVRIVSSSGKIERSVDFQSPIEAEAVSARVEDGNLKVTLPKKRGRKIKVS